MVHFLKTIGTFHLQKIWIHRQSIQVLVLKYKFIHLLLEGNKQIVYGVLHQKLSHVHNQHPKMALQVCESGM